MQLLNRRFLSIFLAILLGATGYEIYLSLQFRIVGTDPKLSNVASVSPFLKVKFNKPLSGTGLVVSSNSSIISSYQVVGQLIDIELKIPLDSNIRYAITIKNIRDTGKDVIPIKVLSFRPRNSNSSSLSNEQRQALLEQQSQKPVNPEFIAYSGLDILINYGVTSAQINDLKTYLFDYSKTARQINIPGSSVKPVPHDSSSATTYDTINFSVLIDKTSYGAKIDYSNLTSLRLYLYNNAGSLMFDSNNPQ